jgi:predicted  nucleic acid-binding Zn-ribbon protein
MMVFLLESEAQLSTYDERLAALEQTVVSLRNDFLQAIVENTRSMSTLNKVILQQEQNARDANHELTILTGVISSQGQDIKSMKNYLNDLGQRFTALEEKVDQRFTTLEEKMDQVLRALTTPPSPQ